MDLEKILDDRKFELSIMAHANRLKKSGVSDETIKLITHGAIEIFSRYKLSNTRNIKGFREDLIDPSIFFGLDPIKTGYIHFLSTQTIEFEDGLEIPFAYSPWFNQRDYHFVFCYLADNDPDYLAGLIKEKLNIANSLLEKGSESFEREVMERVKSEEDRESYISPDEDLKTEEDIKKEIIKEAEQDVNMFKNMLRSPKENMADCYRLFPSFLDYEFTRSFDQIKVVYSIRGGHRLDKYIICISDKFRLMDEHKIETIKEIYSQKDI